MALNTTNRLLLVLLSFTVFAAFGTVHSAGTQSVIVSLNFPHASLGDPKISMAERFITTLLHCSINWVAQGEFMKAAHELFAPLAVVLPPDEPLQYLADPYSQSAWLQQQAPELGSARFTITRLDVYEPTMRRYLGYTVVTEGTLWSRRGPGKFVFIWDLIRDDGFSSSEAENSIYIWALSWMAWNYDEHTTPSPHNATTLSQPAVPREPASLLLQSVTADRADGGDLQHLMLRGTSLEARIVQGPPSPPAPMPDVALLSIQATIDALFNALASGDLLGASRIFGPPSLPAQLFPPGMPELLLASTAQKLQVLENFVASGMTLEVKLEEVVVVKYKGSSYPVQDRNPFHVITRGSYTLLDNTASLADEGKVMQQWTQNAFPLPSPSPAYPGINWYMGWALWSSDGPLHQGQSN